MTIRENPDKSGDLVPPPAKGEDLVPNPSELKNTLEAGAMLTVSSVDALKKIATSDEKTVNEE